MGGHVLSLEVELSPATASSMRALLRAAHALGARSLRLRASEAASEGEALLEAIWAGGEAGMAVVVALSGSEPTDLVGRLAGLPRGAAGGLREIAVTLDGGEAETHDSVHGAGSYARAVALLLLASAHGIETSVESTLHAPSLEGLEGLVRRARRCGAARIVLAAPIPTRALVGSGRMPAPGDLAAVGRRLGWLEEIYAIRVECDLSLAAETAYVVCPPLQGTALAVDRLGRPVFCPRLAEHGEGAAPTAASGTDPADALAGFLDHANTLLAWRAGLVRAGWAPGDAVLYPCGLCAARHGLLGWLREHPESPWARLLEAAL